MKESAVIVVTWCSHIGEIIERELGRKQRFIQYTVKIGKTWDEGKKLLEDPNYNVKALICNNCLPKNGNITLAELAKKINRKIKTIALQSDDATKESLKGYDYRFKRYASSSDINNIIAETTL